MAKRKAPAPAPRPFVPPIACVADVHVHNHTRWGGPLVNGINRRCFQVLDVLHRALERAVERKATHFFIAGDLFHSRRPEPAVLAAVARLLDQKGAQRGLQIVIVPGNHDMVDASAGGGNTACEPLYQVANVIRQPTWLVTPAANVLCVPFDSSAPMAEIIADALPAAIAQLTRLQDGPRVLVTHVGVFSSASKSTPDWMKRAKDAISWEALDPLLRGAGISIAYVGNYHERASWGSFPNPVTQQLGTLAPASFNDEGLGGFFGHVDFYDGDKMSTVELDGPRFVEVETDLQALKVSIDCESIIGKIYMRQRGGAELEVDGIGGYEYVPAAVKPASPAGAVGRVATTAEEAIEAYLSTTVKDSVDLVAVRERVKDLWRRSV